jgi:hypothetical protein
MEKEISNAAASGNILYMIFSTLVGLIFLFLKYGDSIGELWSKYSGKGTGKKKDDPQKMKEKIEYLQTQMEEMQSYIDSNLHYVNDLVMIKNHPLKTYISGMGIFVRFPNTLRVDSMDSFVILLEAFEGNVRSFDSPDKMLTIDFTDVKNFNSTATGALYEFFIKIKKKGGIRLKYIFLRGNKNHEFHYNNIVSLASSYKNDYAAVVLTDRDYSSYEENSEQK